MDYFIGIDGGGTKTHCIIADETKKQLFECYGEATNFLTIGTKLACNILISLIHECKSRLGIGSEQIASIFVAVSGAGRSSDAQFLEEEFHKSTKQYSNVYFDGDAIAALTGAFHEDAGIILISGTGSIILGKDRNGNMYRAGGFGRIIGDEGSGYAIGRKGLSAISKQLDGRGEATLMTKYLNQKFQISSADELITAIYRNNFDISSFAPYVLAAAEQGDDIAFEIVNEAVNELISLVRTVRNKITPEKMSLVLTGSLISSDNILSHKLHGKIREIFPDIFINTAKNSPAYGAMMLGYNKVRDAKK